MSDPITPRGIATIAKAPLQGMITLRADLSDPGVVAAITGAVPADMPGPREMGLAGPVGLGWMSPDEMLVLCPHDDVPSVLAALKTALQQTHALAVNVSDARASFTVQGPHARDVMAKLCPVDLAPAAFGPGMFRRTRMAQVPAAFWMPAPDAFQVVCFRSQAQYAFDVLTAASQPGSEARVYADTR
ncbi:sarcosine oxidase subunit gamma family protein [Roseobacter sp.]|uniref:sarcosine oxidase subunit gamma n=1 Tax=Roseobacter sp. TaxID=1907202 RepID=UPI003298106E